MQKRGIIEIILFSVITCGIYAIYWFYVTANDLNAEDQDGEPLTNYILAILLSIITCGIYGIFWQYKFYKKVDAVTSKDEYLLSLLLSLFFTPIAGMAISQNSINNIVDNTI